MSRSLFGHREAVPDVVAVTVGDDRKDDGVRQVPDRRHVFADVRDGPRRPIHPGVSATTARATRPAIAARISPVIEQVSCASQPTTGATSSGSIGG